MVCEVVSELHAPAASDVFSVAHDLKVVGVLAVPAPAKVVRVLSWFRHGSAGEGEGDMVGKHISLAATTGLDLPVTH